MKVNEGKMDRVTRIIIGVVVLSLAFIGPKTAWGYIGIIPLLTGLIGTCPMYSIFGLNTCKINNR